MKKQTIMPIIIICISTFIWFTYVFNNPIEKEQPQEQITNEIVIDYTNYDLCINHLKEYEGLSLKPYLLDGHYYIGYGQQIKNPSIDINQKEAERMLKETFDWYILFVNKKYDVYGDKALALALLWYNVKPSSILKSDLHYCIINDIEDAMRIRESWLSLCNFKNRKHTKLKERRQFEVNLYFN